jgi:hypothetical protein
MTNDRKIAFAQAGVVLATCMFGAALAAPPEPPPEAFAACGAKTTGDKCTVAFRDQAVAGTCTAFAEKLACRPDQPPQGGPGGPGGPHGPPPEARLACAAKTSGDACAMTLPDGTMRSGACRPLPHGEVLACGP